MLGKHLSHYRIVEEIGRGGMGIVYKAEDTKLDRTVAIKILPPAALTNEDDRNRFYREAKAAAQLQHPNIAAIYQIDEAVPMADGDAGDSVAVAESHPFIAMEYIDGLTLSERIKEAPLKISEAVRIVLGVADALKLAHSKNIVHRDIKSSNIMLDKEGRAKVLDFGLAKTTHSTMLTRLGSTIGTVAYMSPEQARGEDVDNRTDLWALGVVLHELITGRLPFGGDYEQAIVYSILNETNEPLTGLRTGVPMELERIVNKTLAKNADLRYQTAADLMADLKAVNLQASTTRMSVAQSGIVATDAGAIRSTAEIASPPSITLNTRAITIAVIAIVSIGVLGFALSSLLGSPRTPENYLRMNVDIPGVVNPTGMVSSPDGRYWAMSGTDDQGQESIIFYDTRSGAVHRVPNSENLFGAAFSPDGNWLLAIGGNITGSGAGTYRIQVPRGQPIRTHRAQMADWLDDRTLVASTGDSLVTIDIASKAVRLIARTDTAAGYNAAIGVGFLLPRQTPDPKKVLVTAGDIPNGINDLLLYDIETGTYTVVERQAGFGEFVEGGHLIFLKGVFSENDLVLTFGAFDLKSGRFSGPTTTLEEPWAANVAYSLGADMTLFLEPSSGDGAVSGSRIGWFDPENGTIENVEMEPGSYGRIAVSPAGDAVAIESGNQATGSRDNNIVTLDLETASLNRITYDHPYNVAPVFGPVSGRIYYAAGAMYDDPEIGLFVKNADGSGPEEVVVERGWFPTVSPDEKWIAYVRQAPGGFNIYATNLETGEEIGVDTSAGNQTDPAFSPDGNFILYSSRGDSSASTANQSVYVRSFPDVDRVYRKLSEEYQTDDPIWSSTGDFIYFGVSGQSNPYARIAISLAGGFSTRSRVEVMEIPAALIRRVTHDPGSSRLLMNYFPQRSVEENQFDFHIIQNLPALLKEIAPEYQ